MMNDSVAGRRHRYGRRNIRPPLTRIKVPAAESWQLAPSASFPKFVTHRGNLLRELRKQRGTSKHIILAPLFDLKFLNEFAATGAGTSNRRYWNMGSKSMPQETVAVVVFVVAVFVIFAGVLAWVDRKANS
jgi:hypothetical protein